MIRLFFTRVLPLAWVLQLVAGLAIGQSLKWSPDGNSYFVNERSRIVRYDLPGLKPEVVVSPEVLIPDKQTMPISVEDFQFTSDGMKLLFFTNSKRVWRYRTRGDYWVLDTKTRKIRKLGEGRPESSLMFAKFSPDGKKAAYVSERNLYVEDLESGQIKPLTSGNGTQKLIHGTFDWVYEEEFAIRDGFRWSPDGKSIAYWQIDANAIRDFYMINSTDSVYSRIVPVEYPKAGDPPSPARIGVADIASGQTKWMAIEGDPQEHYLPRMEWAPGGKSLVVQQFNRKQNHSRIIECNAQNGACQTIFQESDPAWVSHVNEWSRNVTGWDWIEKGKAFIWTSEKDGWRHLYRVGLNGQEQLLTRGNYDVIETLLIDETGGFIYFYASPENALQQYLYRVPLDGSRGAERLSPASQEGTHSYQISPNGKYARHNFSNYYTSPLREWITLPDHQPLPGQEDIGKKINPQAKLDSPVSFFKVTTADGVEMDGWIVKPKDFDPKEKYPVVFYVYGEPASATVNDRYGVGDNFVFDGDLAAEGYIHISLDNRGTPAPKGRQWRKSIYRKIGQLNIRDQAMAAKKILEWDFVDTSRVAVWGWSGGGSSTLNLMFQYPEIYKTGISIAPVTASRLYDNIYTERYMGLPQENPSDYAAGAALTHAKNLQGNLLVIHGTGDDNVHYQNTEMLIDELVRNGKLFMVMPYPNRTHGISEGAGTSEHLSKTASHFLRTHVPGGPKSRLMVKP
ncbi:MAG: DPP IV N-terminal domain-containing protein [Haliscomenobacter sp.]|nr:DPP IV N-terminal domain-containing protein [Haliscomenobacter sp.]